MKPVCDSDDLFTHRVRGKTHGHRMPGYTGKQPKPRPQGTRIIDERGGARGSRSAGWLAK